MPINKYAQTCKNGRIFAQNLSMIILKCATYFARNMVDMNVISYSQFLIEVGDAIREHTHYIKQYHAETEKFSLIKPIWVTL